MNKITKLMALVLPLIMNKTYTASVKIYNDTDEIIKVSLDENKPSSYCTNHRLNTVEIKPYSSTSTDIYNPDSVWLSTGNMSNQELCDINSIQISFKRSFWGNPNAWLTQNFYLGSSAQADSTQWRTITIKKSGEYFYFVPAK